MQKGLLTEGLTRLRTRLRRRGVGEMAPIAAAGAAAECAGRAADRDRCSRAAGEYVKWQLRGR